MPSKHDLLAASGTLAMSLVDDPFYQAITVEHRTITDKLPVLERYFEYSLAEAQRTGHCFLADNPSFGASAWLLPRSEETDAKESLAKRQFLQALLGVKGFRNYDSILSYMSPRASKHVSAHAWYLSIIGVHPDGQGKGLGRGLLRPTLQLAQQHQVSCYLETFTPRNINFYERLGFKSVAQYLEPTTNATYLIMQRKP